MVFQGSNVIISLPTSQIQTTFFKAATDTNQDGSLTRAEITARRTAINQQLAVSQFPTGSAALTALNTENILLGGILEGTNFNKIAGSRGGGNRSMDVQPQDATIEAYELQAAARVAGSAEFLSNVDLQQLASGAIIPAPPTGIPQPPPVVPNPLGQTVSLPTSQIQSTFFKAATDINADGNLTRAEITARRTAINQQLAVSLFPVGSPDLAALNTEKTLLEGILSGNNFNRIANSRGLGDDQPRTADFRPEDATIQANELASVARVAGSAQFLSNVDLQQLASGAPIPSATGGPGNPIPQPPLPPGIPGNGGGNLQQQLLTLILRLMGISLPTLRPTFTPPTAPLFPPGSPENPGGIIIGGEGRPIPSSVRHFFPGNPSSGIIIGGEGRPIPPSVRHFFPGNPSGSSENPASTPLAGNGFNTIGNNTTSASATTSTVAGDLVPETALATPKAAEPVVNTPAIDARRKELLHKLINLEPTSQEYINGLAELKTLPLPANTPEVQARREFLKLAKDNLEQESPTRQAYELELISLGQG